MSVYKNISEPEAEKRMKDLQNIFKNIKGCTRVSRIAEIDSFRTRIAEKLRKYCANIGNNIQAEWRMRMAEYGLIFLTDAGRIQRLSFLILYFILSGKLFSPKMT